MENLSEANRKNIQDRLNLISKISAILVGTTGAIVLTGWIFNVPTLKSVLPYFVSMKINTAICFLLAGITLWLINKSKHSFPQKTIISSLSFFILLIGALSLCEYIFEKNLGIDEWFMKDDLSLIGTSNAGRMSPLTAIDFMLVGFAFLSFKTLNYKITNALSLLLFATSLFSFSGYLYNIQEFFSVLFYTKMAFLTALAFFSLSIGLLTAQGEKGITAYFTSNTIGGIIARRLIPIVIILLLGFGWLQLYGERQGWYNSAFGEALFSLINISILIIIILWSVKRMIIKDEKRIEVEILLKESQEVAGLGTYTLDIKSGKWKSSEVLDKIFGIDKQYIHSIEGWINIIHPEDKEMMLSYFNEVIQEGTIFNKEYRIINFTHGTIQWLHALGKIQNNAFGNKKSMLGTVSDITLRKKNEISLLEKTEEIRLNEMRLKSLVEILQYDSETIQGFLDHALSEAISLTGSKIGYIYHYSEEKKEFTLNTWSNEVMKGTIAEKQTVYQLDKTGIWGEAVRQRKPIMVNDFKAQNSLKKGYPQGHAHLDNYLTVPVFNKTKIVGVVAVANKPRDYNETDILQLTLLMNAVWKVVDRKRAEISLKEKEERYRSVAQSANDAIISCDSKGIIIDWNPGAEKTFGYLNAEVNGKALTLIIPTHYREQHINGIRRLKQGGEPHIIGKTIELHGLHKSGNEFPIELSIAKWETGKGIFYTGIIRDITKRRQAEDEKKSTDARLRTLLLAIEQSPVTTIITDRTGNMVYVNPKFTETTGYTSEEAIDKNPRILKTEYKQSHEYNELWNTLLSGKNWQGVFHNQKKNGERYWESAVISPVKDEKGTITHFLAVKEDITKRILSEEKRKKDELQLKEHAENLASKNIQLTDFCNIVSHNLRGPLVNISMLIDFMEKAQNENERVEILEKFKPVITNLNESFNELVESLQVKNDPEIKSEKIIVKDCLQKILDGMEVEISKYQASFEINVDDTPEIYFPPKYMSSIFFNLINNSIKYKSPERKPIIKIKTEIINDAIVLSVSDNGLGIDLKKHKNNLFKIRRVFHEHPDAKGFGLFMTKTQVEAMGGKIWAESTPGEGSTFFIEFNKQNSNTIA